MLAQKYRLDRTLGRGGTGTVYAATDLRLERTVAVKLLHPRFAENESVARRFVQEARIAARLRHPNVVEVYDFSVAEDGSFFLVLEYLEGQTLGELVENGPVDPFVLVRLIDPVLEALAEAHRHGVVHRDLKPANIFLAHGPGGVIVPKLLDFGIVKILHGMGSFSTGEGAIMGTPYYMAPEQAQANTKVTPAADVWSIGVVLYEALSGRFPLDYPRGASSATVLVHVCTKPPIPIRERTPELAPELASVIDRCLQHDREARFGDAEALRSALRQLGSIRASEAQEVTDISATSLETPGMSSASHETPSHPSDATSSIREREGATSSGHAGPAPSAQRIDSPPGETPSELAPRPELPSEPPPPTTNAKPAASAGSSAPLIAAIIVALALAVAALILFG